MPIYIDVDTYIDVDRSAWYLVWIYLGEMWDNILHHLQQCEKMISWLIHLDEMAIWTYSSYLEAASITSLYCNSRLISHSPMWEDGILAGTCMRDYEMFMCSWCRSSMPIHVKVDRSMPAQLLTLSSWPSAPSVQLQACVRIKIEILITRGRQINADVHINVDTYRERYIDADLYRRRSISIYR